MFLKKIIVYLCPLFIFLGLELLFYNIRLIYLALGLVTLILFLALKIIIKEKLFSRDFFWLSLLPLLLLYASVGFLFLLNSNSLRHLIILILIIILGFYLENIFLFYYQPGQYQPFSLENFSNLLILLIFFLLILNLNAFSVFLNLPLWQLSIILTALVFALLYQAFWTNKFKSNLKLVYLLIISIIILEIFWGLSFLPTNFYVNSIILTIVFYFVWGIVSAKLKEKLDKKLVWRYIAISSILLLIVILTTPWT